jgi:uncharacterized membrane protein
MTDKTKHYGKGQPHHKAKSVEELTQHNVQTVRALEEAAKAGQSTSERVADVIAGFCGRMEFVWLHVVWFGAWIVINGVPGFPHFDPFPFTFLTFCVSLEAIFLSTFILISQNHETRVSERRNHLDLQVNLLAEQENTLMLLMLKRIAEKVGARIEEDETAEALEQTTQPEKVVKQIEDTIEQENNKAKPG